jgi:hypothetical protein
MIINMIPAKPTTEDSLYRVARKPPIIGPIMPPIPSTVENTPHPRPC